MPDVRIVVRPGLLRRLGLAPPDTATAGEVRRAYKESRSEWRGRRGR